MPRKGRIMIGFDYLWPGGKLKDHPSWIRKPSPGTFDSRLVIFVYGPDSPAAGLCAFEKQFVAEFVQTILLFIGRGIETLAIIGKTLLRFQRTVPARLNFQSVRNRARNRIPFQPDVVRKNIEDLFVRWR